MAERLQQVVMGMAVVATSALLAGCGGGGHHKKKATPTPTAVATRTATLTSTPVSTATATAVSTATSTSVATTTATASRTPTSTAAASATSTASPTSTATPPPTDTPTPTPTPTSDPDCPIRAETELGVICGTTATVAGVRADAFLGIPYGEDTSGANRWAPPVPVTSLPDKFQAKQYGPICPQASPSPGLPQPSEDCLSINVWTPPDRSAEEKLPVMVYIHGGAFLWGSSASLLYDSAFLSSTERVVVVSFNYRLGAIAFLSGIAGLEGNYGFLDQQLALQWVQDNIAAFGGDKEHVTIFGESAGAMSIGLHLLSAPSSEELFDAALMESNPLALPYKTLAESTEFGTLLAGVLNCAPTDLTCLRATTWEAVVAAQEDKTLVLDGLLSGFSGILLWTPVIDGTLLTTEPVAGAEASGLSKPTLLGTNRDEGTVFVYAAMQALGLTTLTPALYDSLLKGLFGGTTAAEIETLYPAETDSAPVASQVMNDYMFFCATRFVAQQGDDTTYAYQFDHVSSFNFFPSVPQCADQVCHTDELPYVFNTAATVGYSFTPAEETLSRQFVGYWGAFAHPGHNPSPLGSGRPAWPAFPGENYLLLDTPPTAAVDPPHHCDFWDTVGYNAVDLDAMLGGSLE